MRTPPKMPAKFVARQNDTVITQVREYQLITPLFGGITPMECDPITVIRATEIRGHLRFWWRATRGGKSGGDMAKMKEEEDRIWGKAGKKDEQGPKFEDTVQIEVEIINKGNPVIPFKVSAYKREKNGFPKVEHVVKDIPSYAAFPLQPDQKERQQKNPPQRSVQAKVIFKLTITFPLNNKYDVEAALWAWETFGGIGARTRRGFGALHLLTVDDKTNSNLPNSNQLNEIKSWLTNNLTLYVTSGSFPTGTPHISQHPDLRIITGYNAPNSDLYQRTYDIWKSLIKNLFDFRQKRTRDAKKGSDRWPDSETARSIVQGTETFYTKKIPKAVIGLPIVFQLSEGKNATIQGKDDGQERMGSPLILRPLAINNNQVIGLALLLEGYNLPPGGLEVVDTKGKTYSETHLIETALTIPEANKIPALDGEANVLKALMNNIEGNKL